MGHMTKTQRETQDRSKYSPDGRRRDRHGVARAAQAAGEIATAMARRAVHVPMLVAAMAMQAMGSKQHTRQKV
jgi:hypothetical protein